MFVLGACLLLLQSAASFRPARQNIKNVQLHAVKSSIPSETVGGYIFAERVVNNVTLTTGGNSTGKPKRTVVSKNPRDWTPYNFRDADGEYDVPFIDEAMWYRLSVRRNSEKKLAESLKMLRDSDEMWGNMFEEVYYPQQPVVRIKDKSLVIAFKAMAPGLVYIKTKMNPDLADDIESLKGVYAFLKNPNNLVVPLSKGEGESIEVMRDRNTAVIDPELMLMKKDEYVSVVSGPRKGRYGILMGAKNGKLEVCLRSEYKDDWDTFEFDQLRYLADPPEKKWMLLTPKEALESLMAKDPYNPTVKAFKKNGLLEEILYPDGRPEGRSNDRDGGDSWGSERKPRTNRFDSAEESQGREGGRSMRSIAVDRTPAPQKAREPISSNDMEDWGSSSSSKSSAPVATASAFDDSFNIAAWGESLSASENKRGQTGDKRKVRDEPVRPREPAATGEDTEDFDSFIQGLLSDMDDSGDSQSDSKDAAPSWNNAARRSPSSPSRSSSSSSSSSTTASSSDSESDGGKGYIIGSTGKREWIPSKEYQLQQPVQYEPRKNVKKESESYSSTSSSSSSSSKSNDWFDDRSGYDAFGSDSSSSDTSRSSRNNIPLSPQVEADRLDSERILNELLMDLDTDVSRGSGADGEVDYFDFSMDSEDLRGADKSARSRDQSSVNSRPPANAAPSSSDGRVKAPKMEDFASFEQYLDALVSHERTSGSDDSSKRRIRRPESSRSRSSGEVDALDDNLVAFLGGEDYGDIGPRTANPTDRFQPSTYVSRSSDSDSKPARVQTPADSDRYSDSESRPKRVWTPKAPAALETVPGSRSDSESKSVRVWTPKVSVEESEGPSEQQDDGLSAFLDSLEESNVLPSKQIKVAVAIEEKVAPAVTEFSAVARGEGKAVAKSETVIAAASLETSKGSSETLSKMTVKDLKDKLREKGLPVGGIKAELIHRLLA